MKSIANQYRDLKEGKMSQANFMRNLRMSMPQYVTNVTSFNDAVRILKNKRILNEGEISREAELGKIEDDFKSLLAKGYSYSEALELIAQNSGMDPDELEAMLPQDAVDIEGHEGEDDELAAMVAKAEEEEFGPEKYKFQDFPGGISEAEEFFPRSPIKMAELIAQKHGEELKNLSGRDRQKMALSHAYETILNSDHPKAKVVAKNLVWGYTDEDWPMDYISALNDILQGDIDLYPGNMGDEMSAPTEGKINEAKKKKEPKAELHPNQIHPQELRMGIKVELEHTDDLDKAKKIALDHLKENPFYYTALKLAGVESPSAPKVKAPVEKKARKKKEAVELVDKANAMQKVKMPKADEKKKLKEARLNIDGEPNAVVKQAMGYVDGPNANPTLKALSSEIEFQQTQDPNEALLRYDYWKRLPEEAIQKLELQFNVEEDRDSDEDTGIIYVYRLTPKNKGGVKDLGASFDKFKSQLEEIVREVVTEYYDGRDNLDAETEK